jgi:hypothetical protein
MSIYLLILNILLIVVYELFLELQLEGSVVLTNAISHNVHYDD